MPPVLEETSQFPIRIQLEFAGCTPQMAAEGLTEVALVAEAAFLCDFGKGTMFGAQQSHCPLNSACPEVLSRSTAEELSKRAAEVNGMNSDFRGDRLDTDPSAAAFMQQFSCCLQPTRSGALRSSRA
jgi:hypothetical protein